MQQLEMLEKTDERRCWDCKEIKEIEAFSLHPTRGRHSECKECHSRYSREHYQKNKQKYKERGREYARNSVKAKAVKKVNYAIRSGKLTRQPCEECGAEKAEGHHDDYAKPLEVRWLCRSHHRQHHAKHGEAKNACTVRHWTPTEELKS